MFKLVFGKALSRYLFVLVCLTFVSGCVAILPTPDVTQHGDRLVVMETHVRADLTSINGMIKISREFYRHYEDEFDVLVLVYNTEDEIIDQWEPNAKGRWAGVRHAETGTGRNNIDIGRVFGSESRLKGVVQLASPKRILDGCLLHEIMHMWVSRIEVIPTVIAEHWGFSSVGGLLGGFQKDAFLDLGRGKYSAGYFFPHRNVGTIPYSELEMYLAGWIPPAEVPEIWVAEDGAWLSKELTPETLAECEIENGPLAGTLDQNCMIQTDSNGNKIFTASKISTWTIEQIVENLGPRVPNYEHSQKEFRAAFVLVTHPNRSVTNSELEFTDLLIEQFSVKQPISKISFWLGDLSENRHLFNFWEATKGIATLEVDDLQAFRK